MPYIAQDSDLLIKPYYSKSEYLLHGPL